MKEELISEFKIGDIVWHKNFITNVAIKTTVESVQVMEYGDGSKCVLYITEDMTPVSHIIGVPKNSTCLFSSKEECDSYPPYIPPELKSF